MTAQQRLERAILCVLTAAPRAINAPAIMGALPAYGCSDDGIADINAALLILEAKSQVARTRSEDHGMLWKETADGRLRIAA
jgi:hypothetical protein